MSLPIDQRLAAALAECEQLRAAENQQLRERQGLPQVESAAQSTGGTVEFNSTPAAVASKSSSDEKVKLFRSLYVDGCVPVLSAMYSRRVRGYEAVGYQIQNGD